MSSVVRTMIGVEITANATPPAKPEKCPNGTTQN